MTFAAYMLRCADGSYYLGHSDDLERRLAEHRAAAIPGYAATRLPVSLVWSESFSSREEAMDVERQLKSWSRARKEALIRGDRDAVQSLTRKSVDTGLRQAQPRRGKNGDADAEHRAPLIVLVRPQLGQNIGKAARAMLNFGLTELRIVAPRDGWPNPAAGPAASGADSVLENARIFGSVADAVADCAHVYATTVRRRSVTKPVVTPAEAATEIHAAPGRTAILFGPERSGLETDDVAIARSIITVPINPQFGSLNLAQAVILVAYEWSKTQSLAQPPAVDIEPPARQAELDGMIEQLDAMLDAAGFFFPRDRTPTTKRILRTMLTKPGWTSQEVRTMRGMLSQLAKPQTRD